MGGAGIFLKQYISDAERGRIEELKDICILNQKNIHKAALEVAAENKNALNLYKSCGFAGSSVTDYYEAL